MSEIIEDLLEAFLPIVQGCSFALFGGCSCPLIEGFACVCGEILE